MITKLGLTEKQETAFKTRKNNIDILNKELEYINYRISLETQAIIDMISMLSDIDTNNITGIKVEEKNLVLTLTDNTVNEEVETTLENNIEDGKDS